MDSEKSNGWTLVVNKKQKNLSFAAPTTSTSTYSNTKGTSNYEKITIKRNGQTRTY